MNKKFLHGALLLSLMFVSVPSMFAEGEEAVAEVIAQENVVKVVGNWVKSQLNGAWDQLYNKHPRLAVSALMIAASALAYRSDTIVGKKMRSATGSVCDTLRGLCPCIGSEDDARRSPRVKRERVRVGCPVACTK